MILSAFLVETLTVLVEPPPAIGGALGNQQLSLRKIQHQANIGVFMFLFMFCAFEVVFIKLISYATQPADSNNTNRSATVGTQTLSEEDELNNNNVSAESVTPTVGQPNSG